MGERSHRQDLHGVNCCVLLGWAYRESYESQRIRFTDTESLHHPTANQRPHDFQFFFIQGQSKLNWSLALSSLSRHLLRVRRSVFFNFNLLWVLFILVACTKKVYFIFLAFFLIVKIDAPIQHGIGCHGEGDDKTWWTVSRPEELNVDNMTW